MAVETDHLHKTLKRLALVVLIGSMLMGIIAAMIPGVPGMFAIGIPALGLLIAGNIYHVTQQPRGSYTKRTVKTFDSVYRPLKPVSNRKTGEPGEEAAEIDPVTLRAEIEAMKRRG